MLEVLGGAGVCMMAGALLLALGLALRPRRTCQECGKRPAAVRCRSVTVRHTHHEGVKHLHEERLWRCQRCLDGRGTWLSHLTVRQLQEEPDLMSQRVTRDGPDDEIGKCVTSTLFPETGRIVGYGDWKNLEYKVLVGGKVLTLQANQILIWDGEPTAWQLECRECGQLKESRGSLCSH